MGTASAIAAPSQILGRGGAILCPRDLRINHTPHASVPVIAIRLAPVGESEDQTMSSVIRPDRPKRECRAVVVE
jgi:hypothetical protein